MTKMFTYMFCHNIIRGMSVVSVRVDKRVKEILERAGINVSKEIRRYLDELAWKIELRESIERLSQLLREIPPADKGFSARSVREDREGN